MPNENGDLIKWSAASFNPREKHVETDEGSFRVIDGKVYLWDVGIGNWRLVGREIPEGESPTRTEWDEKVGAAQPTRANYWTEAKANKYFSIAAEKLNYTREQDIASKDEVFGALAGNKDLPSFPEDVEEDDGLTDEDRKQIFGGYIPVFAPQEMKVESVSFGSTFIPHVYKVYLNGKEMTTGEPLTVPEGTTATTTMSGGGGGGGKASTIGTVTVQSCYPVRHVTPDGFELNIWPGTEVSHAGKIYTCGWDYCVTVRDCIETPKGCKHDWRPSKNNKKWCASCGVYDDPKPPDFPAPEPTPPMPEERYD